MLVEMISKGVESGFKRPDKTVEGKAIRILAKNFFCFSRILPRILDHCRRFLIVFCSNFDRWLGPVLKT